MSLLLVSVWLFFNDTATTEIYTLSLHDALPICGRPEAFNQMFQLLRHQGLAILFGLQHDLRSEEHTSELQSQPNLVRRLLREKKTLRNLSVTSHFSVEIFDVFRLCHLDSTVSPY